MNLVLLTTRSSQQVAQQAIVSLLKERASIIGAHWPC